MIFFIDSNVHIGNSELRIAAFSGNHANIDFSQETCFFSFSHLNAIPDIARFHFNSTKLCSTTKWQQSPEHLWEQHTPGVTPGSRKFCRSAALGLQFVMRACAFYCLFIVLVVLNHGSGSEAELGLTPLRSIRPPVSRNPSARLIALVSYCLFDGSRKIQFLFIWCPPHIHHEHAAPSSCCARCDGASFHKATKK